MTAPVRLHQFGPGHRTPATLLMLDERDRYLRSAAELYCDGMSRRRAAEWLEGRLKRYFLGAWRRDRESLQVPGRLENSVEALCWMMLKCKPTVVSEELIRKVIARNG
jgi:hypothetical protein